MDNDGYEGLRTILMVLLDREGGAVTLTEEELRAVDTRRRLHVSTAQSLQDDTIRVWVK